MATSVSAGFNELLSRLQLTDNQKESAKKRVAAIKKFFKEEFVMAEGPITIGSYARNSIIRSERDIDILAPLNYPHYKATYDNKPQEMLYMVRDALNDEYGSTTVSSQKVAVKLNFTDITVDVVPCFRREGGGYFMPNASGGWMATNPPFHNELMSESNTKHGNYLRPVVKFMKFWNNCNGHHLSSLHVELMTWRIWRDGDLAQYITNHNYSGAVADTLRCMQSWAKVTFPDPWDSGENSKSIDLYLSANERALAVRMLEQDASNSKQAEDYRKNGRIDKAFERWQVVFGQKFPAYG
jgi:hypothetical protein